MRTSRHRGGTAYIERRTNAWAAMIGYLTGKGYSSVAIAAAVEGTSAATVRRMWRLWGIPVPRSSIVIDIGSRERANLAKRAEQHQLSIEEYCRRLLVHGSMPKDRYRDIVDGA
jgi:hypothetical protein